MNYRLYVDEVGNDDLGHIQEEGHRYLSLTGLAMHQDVARDVTPRLAEFKMKIFQHDPDMPVILHRKDIINLAGPFHKLRDENLKAEFDSDLITIMTDTDYTVITAVIDKLEMTRQEHWAEKHPYHYLMKILVEKYVQWLERKGGVGDIMPEMRKGRKDRALQDAYDNVRKNGCDFGVTAKRVADAIPASKLKFRDKPANIAGLQLCDLLAHPSHMNARKLQGHDVTIGPFSQKIIPLLTAAKYDRSPWTGRISGYGTKYLP